MENPEIKITGRPVELPTGAVFYVNPGNYAEADELLSAFLACIQDRPVGFENEDSLKVYTKTIVSHAFVNARLKAAIWAAMARCLYKPKSKEGALGVSQKLFNEVSYREDLVEALYECAKENLEPFSKGLYAVSSRLAGTITNTLK